MTSSIKMDQANGKVEQAIQTIKNALKKEIDHPKALMSNRVTPLESRYSPAEMLFGRKIQTYVPWSTEAFWAWLTGSSRVWTRKQDCQTKRYYVSHQRTDLPAVKPGGHVWVVDQKKPWSYVVVTQDSNPILTPSLPAADIPTGAPFRMRRERHHLYNHCGMDPQRPKHQLMMWKQSDLDRWLGRQSALTYNTFCFVLIDVMLRNGTWLFLWWSFHLHV